jgi:glycosyltransferase involved in cell wall biosynthesis
MKFSIILPVHNGGKYVKACVNSILGQTLPDFNLLVLENKSTDGTFEWISSINDSRIKVLPSNETLSIEKNWARIISIPKNEFITLIGHDDLLHRDYLQTMNQLINLHPNASLYQTHFNYIDEKGIEIRKSKPMPEIENAEDFLGSFLNNNVDVMGTGFMMRSKDYDRLGGIPSYPNLLFADFELWIKATRLSYKATSSKECFSFRLHQSTTAKSPDTKFQKAFEQFVYFLNALIQDKESFRKTMLESAGPFLMFYCKSLAHRLLRTPKEKREGLTVSEFIAKCKGYADLLGVENTFYPDKVSSIKLARYIDQSSFRRNMFLLFKKFYSKPILK